MFFWGICRVTPGIPGIRKRNRGKPREIPSDINDVEAHKVA
jgi:hypothetical protein